MIASIRTELLKLRTTRTTEGSAMAGLALAALLGAATASIAGHDGAPALGSATWVADAIGVSTLPVAMALLLGVLLSAGEHQHGTIATTFLVTPRRTRVLAAKAACMAVAGPAVAIAMMAASALATVPALTAHSTMPDVADRRVAVTAVGMLVACSLLGAAGALLGMLVRSQAAAIVIVVGWALLVEGVVDTIVGGGLRQWLPGGAAGDLIGHGPHSHLLAAALLAGWTGALAAITRAVVCARDVA